MEKRIFKFALILFLFLVMAKPVEAVIDPQYIFVRKSPMECNPTDCSYLWNFMDPVKINKNAFDDVINKVGTRGNDQRKLGVAVEINYLLYDNVFAGVDSMGLIEQSLRNLLKESRDNQIPIFINLSGFQWLGDGKAWTGRPDLWNWWDSTKPGYDIENKNNVEWTCWDNSCAINKSWRNWGSEFELRPHPNLASRKFIEANKERLKRLIPIIVGWLNELPIDKKWLFGGISLGTETDIGGNYYYYKNGIKTDRGLTDSVQLGYAAVKTAGIRSSGDPPTVAELNEVVRRYVNELDELAYSSGVPRQKIFNHIGGADLYPIGSRPTNLNFVTSLAAVMDNGNPGWSFYGDVTKNPQNYPELNMCLNQIYTAEWSSPEWLTSALDSSGWATALRNSLNYRNDRLVNVANWEGIREKTYALTGLKTVLNEVSVCWVTAPEVTETTVLGNQVTLKWTKGQYNDTVYVNISNSKDTNPGGGFKNINVANSVVTNETSLIKTGLANGTYFWQLIADGCSNQRRRVSGSFTINNLVTISPTPIPVVGDADGNGKVDILDFAIWKREFLSGEGIKSDFSGDGKVSLIDFGIWRGAYLTNN